MSEKVRVEKKRIKDFLGIQEESTDLSNYYTKAEVEAYVAQEIAKITPAPDPSPAQTDPAT